MWETDGTVISSVFRYPTDPMGSVGELRNTHGLFLGRVVASYPTDSGLNISKTEIEYDVEIEFTAKNGLGTKRLLPRCRVADGFGGVADYSRWTPRLQPLAEGEELRPENFVLVQCVSGWTDQARIVGGICHPKGKVWNPVGVQWEWEFNGIHFLINDAGELQLSFRGATEANGDLRSSSDKAASGSSILLKKDGSVELTSGGGQKIRIDHAAKTIEVDADQGYAVRSSGKITLKSPVGTDLGDATQAHVLGTAYRAAETASNSAVAAAHTATASALGLIAAALTALIAGPAYPAEATAPLLAPAAAAAAAAAALEAAAAAAVTGFEAAAPTYLSLKNHLD